MLSPDKLTPRIDPSRDTGNEADFIDFDKLIAIVRRQWRIVAVCAFVFAILGVVYVLTAVPVYTAETKVLIDRSDNQMINQLAAFGQLDDDEGTVLSQVELLKSDTIAYAVVDKLKLVDDPVFTAQKNSLFSVATLKSLLNFRSWFADDVAVAPDPEMKRRWAAETVAGNIDVERVGKSYVLDVTYTSQSPDLAREIAAAIADVYLVDKLNSKYEATRRAGEWLQERIEELRQQALDTDLAVQKFRSEHGLVEAGSGTLLSEQQLSELNTQLIKAQAETAQAEAKYTRIKSIIDARQTDAIVTDVLDSSISNDLRKKYLEASKLEAEIEARLGPDHVQAVRLRAEMAEYERLMFDELNRIAESYQSELTVAQSREKSLRDSVDKATGVAATAGETQVQLRELERTRDTYKNLYQSFLARYQEAIQQQSFPITAARIITTAETPTKPSAPKRSLVIAFAMFLGCAFGSGIGAFREFRDRFFRTGDDVRDMLDVESLGVMPLIENNVEDPTLVDPGNPRSIARGGKTTTYVEEHPLSAFAETLRSAKIAIDISASDQRCKVIGMVSSLPGEGKSTTAINFAKLLAMQGARCLLIDGDMRNPGATRAIGRHAEAGLLEAIVDNRPLKDLILLDPRTKLAFLPTVARYRVPHSSELLASRGMDQLLEIARQSFDYIIVDLPPLAPVVDARAINPKLDAVVFVIEWGKTSRKVVQSTLLSEPDLYSKCVGAILTKVDPAQMKLYRTFGSSEYYYKRYSRYYTES
ncbi:polysaccharide biosynthesis tyrosine autokinase [Rhizobium bangladeshense]|uniref:non-specific protein-tyrosine kinase n=1 Tax=Rhizobium bangladeshense TaxID=1138189 RepID=A0ABS7LBB7_9HYPH|nr:polysaccharide biosynthesis tyrosine autokinase [Rhizobium bangladeshense]MBX4866457.1 polysaccharide biosynthesis tyrosine autokinase [Rhizobium bangladeshense]MBX4873578.1 polysaccharide biosynthesis tyrosine autokinase [Rhizobium bangladeshense]MBX4885435.1 polysaccharide biosynthesis tyrosine autokinase [Rhizobium bangladeshense]MBX4894105.1 polysaccharide biosynthesis tyrosine autokinase [Rhizobium bangladeshense]MBX4900019.1 polysaccharide biosynthesis tyrosine autokinase [Rhizobium b